MVSIMDLKIGEPGLGKIVKEDELYFLKFNEMEYLKKANLNSIRENEYHYIQTINIQKDPLEMIPSRGNLRYLGDGRIEIPIQYVKTQNRPPWEGQYEEGEILLFIFEELHS